MNLVCAANDTFRSPVVDSLLAAMNAEVLMIHNGKVQNGRIQNNCQISLTCTTMDPIPHFTLSITAETSNPLLLIYVTDNSNSIPEISTTIRLSGSNCTLIECHLYEGSQTELIRNNTEIHLEKNCHLKHFLIKQGSALKPFTKDLVLNISKNGGYEAVQLALQGPYNSTNLTVHLTENEAKCRFYNLLFPSNHSTSELTATINHHKPYTQSHCVTRTVLPSYSKGKMFGKIIVQEGAKQSSAHLENKSLLLSSTAEAYTKPEFEIYHDDLRCTHGATVGHLDDDALFYLKSRGIPEQEARKLLINAFIEPILERITQQDTVTTILLQPFLEMLQDELEKTLEASLHA